MPPRISISIKHDVSLTILICKTLIEFLPASIKVIIFQDHSATETRERLNDDRKSKTIDWDEVQKKWWGKVGVNGYCAFGELYVINASYRHIPDLLLSPFVTNVQVSSANARKKNGDEYECALQLEAVITSLEVDAADDCEGIRYCTVAVVWSRQPSARVMMCDGRHRCCTLQHSWTVQGTATVTTLHESIFPCWNKF